MSRRLSASADVWIRCPSCSIEKNISEYPEEIQKTCKPCLGIDLYGCTSKLLPGCRNLSHRCEVGECSIKNRVGA